MAVQALPNEMQVLCDKRGGGRMLEAKKEGAVRGALQTKAVVGAQVQERGRPDGVNVLPCLVCKCVWSDLRMPVAWPAARLGTETEAWSR